MDAPNYFDDHLLAGNLLAQFQSHDDEPRQRRAPHPMNVQALLSEGDPPQTDHRPKPHIELNHEPTPQDEAAMSDDDLLAQFQADTDRVPHEPLTLPDEDEGQAEDQGQDQDQVQVQSPAGEPVDESPPKKALKRTVQVVVPKATNSHEFKPLPGHSELDRVLDEVSDMADTLYRIKLGSAEVVTVRYHLSSLLSLRYSVLITSLGPILQTSLIRQRRAGPRGVPRTKKPRLTYSRIRRARHGHLRVIYRVLGRLNI